jgi:hypothetical protein
MSNYFLGSKRLTVKILDRNYILPVTRRERMKLWEQDNYELTQIQNYLREVPSCKEILFKELNKMKKQRAKEIIQAAL